MPVHSFTSKWNDAYGQSLTKQKDLFDTAELSIDITVDDGVSNYAMPCALVAAKTSGLYIVSSQNATIKINGFNEIVTITQTGAVGTEYFILVFGGNTTAHMVTLTTTGATLTTALEALASIGVGRVVATGPAGGPWVVTFAGTLALTNVGAITQGALDPSAIGTIAILVTLNGSAAAQTVTMLAGIPIMWYTGCNLAYPFSIDTVNFYISNASGIQLALNVRQLFHP